MNIDLNLAPGIASAAGLEDRERRLVEGLVRLWSRVRSRNQLRERYYRGHIEIKDLGIAIPSDLAKKINPRIDWPYKAVHALADRSVFDGYTTDDDTVTEELRAVCTANALDRLYRKNLIGELKHCCGFWTVTAGDDGQPIVSAYPATAAAAIWDDTLKAIGAGMAVVESRETPSGTSRVPTLVDVFTADAVLELRADGGRWVAERHEHSMGRPLMEPMPYGATLERPFGTSRISRAVMSITDDAIRQRARMEVAAESSTLPQMWLLGTREPMVNDGNRYDASMGAINEITKDADGDVPSIWQSSQLQMTPLSEYFKALACQMASVTNVPVSFFGVSNDNPSSSDAIAAALEPLVIDAKNLNRDNGVALRNVAYMALAVLHGTDYATERDAGSNINPRFLSPAYPSVVSLSDAVLKQVQAIPRLANSDVTLEQLDFTAEQIQRIDSDNRRAEARDAVLSLLNNEGESSGGGSAQPAG